LNKKLLDREFENILDEQKDRSRKSIKQYSPHIKFTSLEKVPQVDFDSFVSVVQEEEQKLGETSVLCFNSVADPFLDTTQYLQQNNTFERPESKMDEIKYLKKKTKNVE
jgi:hypothetical protein